MEETVIAPAQGHDDSDELAGPQCSMAVSAHRSECTRTESELEATATIPADGDWDVRTISREETTRD